MLPSAVHRALYRSLARCSRNGAALDVIPWDAVCAFAARTRGLTPIKLLSSHCREKAESMAMLRDAFANTEQAKAGSTNDPFDVLRRSSLLSHALRPDSLPSSMPALIENRSLLPGERCRFMFFEPATHALVEHAMKDGDRRFVHLTERPGRSPRVEDVEATSAAPDAVGSVITILSARDLPFGRLVLECVAGPRVRIASHSCEVIESLDDLSPPDHHPRNRQLSARTTTTRSRRLLHVKPALLSDDGVSTPYAELLDDDCDVATAVEALRRELSARLLHQDNAALLGFNAMTPPLFCAERLSLFLCTMLLHADDTAHRLAALHTTSTHERLLFCKNAMDQAEYPQPAKQQPRMIDDAVILHMPPAQTREEPQQPRTTVLESLRAQNQSAPSTPSRAEEMRVLRQSALRGELRRGRSVFSKSAPA